MKNCPWKKAGKKSNLEGLDPSKKLISNLKKIHQKFIWQFVSLQIEHKYKRFTRNKHSIMNQRQARKKNSEKEKYGK